jgi:sialate O-acetylesterase
LFDRIGYLLELESARSGQQKVFVSMDAFTDDVTKIGIPTLESKARFQQTVNALEVFSNVDSLTAGTDIKTGNIEFWPDNYSAANGLGISGASQSVYDFGDDPGAPRDGYGSMQVHNYASGQTVFSVNHWKQGDQADIGIGNSPGDTRDWTFTGNAGSYSKKRLRVYVRPKQ